MLKFFAISQFYFVTCGRLCGLFNNIFLFNAELTVIIDNIKSEKIKTD